jgi:hypothetical protein
LLWTSAEPGLPHLAHTHLHNITDAMLQGLLDRLQVLEAGRSLHISSSGLVSFKVPSWTRKMADLATDYAIALFRELRWLSSGWEW